MSVRIACLTLVAFGATVSSSVHGQRPAPSGAAMVSGAFVVSGRSIPVDDGWIRVPANRTSGSPDSLTLRFVRFRSTSGAPRAPIVFLAGGPGDAATRAVAGMPHAVLAALRSIADVIAFDQRGTGGSEPVNATCPPGAMLPLGMPADPALMLDRMRLRLTTCLPNAARAGIDVKGLTTAESADDLAVLRTALGVPRLSVLAGSYGTHLALAAARRHPALLERMVLAGVEGPDDTIKLPARVDTVLQSIASARRPTLLDDIRLLTARLEAEPARVTGPGGQEIVVGAWDLQRWVAESLDSVTEINAMVAIIDTLLAGEVEALARWAFRARLPRPINLMNLAMDCASFASADRLARVAREAPHAVLGDVIDFPLPHICELPGLPRLPDTFRAPITSPVPALLIVGTFDGRTPVQNALAVSRGMPRSRTLVIEGASHGLFGDATVMAAILAFLRE